MGDHTTSDDAARYRTKEEVLDWEKRDPILRFQSYLKAKGLWDEAYEARVQAEATGAVERAVEAAEARPPAAVADLFAYTYAAMPPSLRDELDDLNAFLAGGAR